MQRSFAGGEIAPGLSARADLAKYISGLRTCRNFIVQRHGGVTNRAGSRFVAETKTSGSSESFLRPFIFAAANQSYAIECGDLYFRFHFEGAPVVVESATAWSNVTAYVAGDLASRLGVIYYCKAAHTNQQPPNATYWHPLPIVDGQNIYEIPTPYEAGKFKPPAPACMHQSGDVITITHLDEAPRELRRYAATRWVLADLATGASIAAPTTPAGTAGAVGTRTYRYVVTAAKLETYEESDPSTVITVATAAEPTVDAPIALTWDANAEAAEFYVYGDGGAGNNTFGYLGVATGTAAFNDTGYVPEFGSTPPVPRVLFNATNAYPGVNAIYQQRRICAGTHTDREVVYGSQTGFYRNFGIRSPLQDDDAVTFTIAAKHIHPVLHLRELAQGLVLLTDGGEWIIRGDESGILRPTAINPKQHGYVGSSFTEPVVIGERILFVQKSGRVLRDLRFDERVEGLSGRDLCLWAGHLFTKGKTIVELAYAAVPDSTVWAVRSDGVLLGLTYIPEEEIWGWHRHDTDGLYESVCVIPEGDEDAVYVVVKRTINGTVRRYVERFDSRHFEALEDACFLDAALTYDGAPATVISGLEHLEGMTVKAFADGAVVPGTFTVSSAGAITLPAAKSTVTVGLPITAELETLDLDVSGSSVRDKRKTVKAIDLLLEASARGFLVGPDASHLYAHRAETWEASGLVTDQVGMTLTTGFTNRGRVLIRHTDPTPLTILGLMPQVEVAG